MPSGGHQQRGRPLGVTEPDETVLPTGLSGEVLGDDGGVVPVALPVDGVVVRQLRVAVPASIQAEHVEGRGQPLGDRQVGTPMEAGGVGDQHDRVVGSLRPGQLVEGDRHAVRRRDAQHGSSGAEVSGRRDGGAATM